MSGFLELINRKSPREDTEHSLQLRLFTYFSVALGIFAAGFYNELIVPMFFGIAGITAGYTFSYFRREYTNWWSRIILTFAMAAAGYYYVSQMIFSGRYHIVVLTEMLIALQVMHSFDLPRRKDLVYSVLSAFMLICVGGVQSRTIWYGAYLLLFAAISLTMLAIYHYQEASFNARVKGGGPRRLARSMLALGGFLLLGSPVFFILLPRYETHALSGLPVSGQVRQAMQQYSGQILYPEMQNQLGGNGAVGFDGAVALDEDMTVDENGGYGDAYFGFSPTLNLNARGRFSDRILMRVRTSSANYYRGLVFDKYTKRGWKLSDMNGTRITSSHKSSLLQLTPHKAAALANPPFTNEEVFQTFFFEQDMPNIIYAALEPYELYFPIPEIVMDKNVALRASYILRKDTIYTVVSKSPKLQIRYLRLATTKCPEELAQYCSTENIPPEIAQFAREITAGADNNFDRLMMIRNELMNGYQYDLNAPRAPQGEDPISFFLFKSKRGFCEHFASAFVLMGRSVGVPTRLVTGFAPGRYNPFTAMFELRGTDAHAWAEADFPFVGWVQFDPTPPGPAGPIGYEKTTPFSFMMNNIAVALQGRLGAVMKAIMLRVNSPGGAAIAIALGGAVCVILCYIIYVLLSNRRKLTEDAMRELPESNKKILRMYRDIVASGVRHGLPVTPASVPGELCQWFPAETRTAYIELALLYQRAAYSRHAITDSDLDAAAEHSRIIKDGLKLKASKQYAGAIS